MQTAYLDSPVRPVPGLEFDTNNPVERRSSILISASARPGIFVSKPAAGASATKQSEIPSATGQITNLASLRGILRGDVAVEGQPNGSALRLFNQYDAITYIRKGLVWVEAETGITVGGSVFVRFAAGAGGTVLGVIRNDADTATASQIPVAHAQIIEISTTNGSTGAPLALLALNLP